MKQTCFLLLLVLLLQMFSASALASKLTVVSTIPPLAMLVEAIGGERVQQQVLLKESVWLHGYSLGPSDVKMLKNADIVFWVSVDLERFLNHLLQQSAPPLWQDEDNHTDNIIGGHSKDEAHEHRHGEDFHVWLDPSKAQILAQKIAQRLSAKDPEGQSYFQARLALLAQEIEQVDGQIGKLVANENQKVIKKQWVIQHQAYRHLLEAYHLPEPLVFSLVPEHPPSLRGLMQLRQSLVENNNDEVCVVLEPGLSDRPLRSLLKGRSYQTVEIDSLGWRFDSYPVFLMAMVQSWLYCEQTAKK